MAPAEDRAPLYAPVHSVRLAHRQRGSGIPFVLLHGLGDTADLWRHQVPELSRGYQVVTLDLRGHGRSPAGSSPFELEEMADDVRYTLTELTVSRAIIAGLSMGGGVAQSLAVRFPELVHALILVSTSSEFPDETRKRFLDRAAKAEQDGMAAVVDATVPRWFTTSFMEACPREVDRTRRAVLDMDPGAFAAASRANAARHFTEQLRTIACPVLFIGGARDPADPRRAIAIYEREIAHFRHELIPDASHLVPVEAPSAFNALVRSFLRDVKLNPSPQGELQ